MASPGLTVGSAGTGEHKLAEGAVEEEERREVDVAVARGLVVVLVVVRLVDVTPPVEGGFLRLSMHF